MTSQLLNLPINIPWKLIAASPDMMDTEFCNKLFPFAWRTSLALSVYEPRPEELPEELCDERITYLKLTCSITGYQPSKEETGQIVSYLSDQPTEDQREALERSLTEYFACYGALINIAVFPGAKIIKKFKEVKIDFAQLPTAGTSLPNPFELGGVKFEVGALENRIVDIFPAGGDAQGELDVHGKLVVTFPPADRVDKVEAKVAHFSSDGVTMEAFKGGISLGSMKSGPDEGLIHHLVFEGEGIDSVMFTSLAEPDKASLLELTYSLFAGETSTVPKDLKDYPHIIDFEPKMRDLYQAATESAEILSGSKSGIKTDKSFTHTENTQNSWTFGAGTKVPVKGVEVNLSGSYNHANSDTDETQWAVQTDASRERRETQSTATQISQLYNLLTGYHIGTNRALFLMLARPHVLQPTDFRTFVQGFLGGIKGIQECFIIVARPKDIDGLCVEAFLETGNFPEDTQINEPPAEYYTSFEDFNVPGYADGGLWGGECKPFAQDHTISTGWVVDIDPNRGSDPGHGGIQMIKNDSNTQANDSLRDYKYSRSADASVRVEGTICGHKVPGGANANFDRTYRVFTRSVEPKPTHQESSADVGRLIITNRGLCVCFKSGDCPEVVPLTQDEHPSHRVIVDEPMIKLNPVLLTREATSNSRSPAMKEFLKQVERSMTNSWRLPSRYPIGEVGFLESDYFKDQMKIILPPDYLLTPLSQVEGIPRDVVHALGARVTVREVLDMNLGKLAGGTGLDFAEAAKVRRLLLRLEPGETGGPR